MDRSLYSNLFHYVATETRNPLENFLTEAFADLLNRLFMEKSEIRQKTESFITQVVCNGYGGQELDARLRSAGSLRFLTQQQMWLSQKPKRLDLCLYADGNLILVIENKVAETRGAKADLSVDDPAATSRIADQLRAYAQLLKEKSGLVLLGIDEGPGDFLSDAKKYPAKFRSVCHWTQVWHWMKEQTDAKVVGLESTILLSEFVRFLEDKNLSDITRGQLASLGNCLSCIQEFLSDTEERIIKILRELRPFAERTLPHYQKQDRATKLPSGEVRAGENHAIGDFAYCYDDGIRHWELRRLRWFVGWGFQESTKGQGGLEAFVAVESDYGGTVFPVPTATERTRLESKGWSFSPDIQGDEGTYSSFSKVCDAADFLSQGFSGASVKWFKDGIIDAKVILKGAKKQLSK